MSVTPSSTTVGVFRDRALAEQAIEALYRDGFAHDTIRFASPSETTGSFFEDLKSFFAGPSTAASNIAGDLADMGLSDDEARYYANEYANGNTILAVQPAEREQEVLSILHQYGAYNARKSSEVAESTPSDAQPTSTYASHEGYIPVEQQVYSQEESHVEDYVHPSSKQHVDTTYANPEAREGEVPAYHPSSPETTYGDMEMSGEEYNASSPAKNRGNEVVSAGATYTGTERKEEETVSGERAEHQSSVDATSQEDEQDEAPVYQEPVETLNAEEDVKENEDVRYESPAGMNPHISESEPAEYQQPGVTETEYNVQDVEYNDAEPEKSRYNTEPNLESSATESSYDTEPHLEPSANVSDYDKEPNLTYGESEGEAQPATWGDTTDARAHSFPVDHTGQLSGYQEQLQAVKQRLEEAKSQLQRAKDHEQQIQSIKQELEAAQAELDATMAQLNETHTRIAQY